jgi:hypothetical protein
MIILEFEREGEIESVIIVNAPNSKFQTVMEIASVALTGGDYDPEEDEYAVTYESRDDDFDAESVVIEALVSRGYQVDHPRSGIIIEE